MLSAPKSMPYWFCRSEAGGSRTPGACRSRRRRFLRAESEAHFAHGDPQSRSNSARTRRLCRSGDAARRVADERGRSRNPHIEFCPPSGRLAVKCGIGRPLLAVNAERPRAPEDGACGTGSREDTPPHFSGCNENCGLADKLLRSVTRRRRCT